MLKGQIFYTEHVKNELTDFCSRHHKKHIVFICDVHTEKYCLPLFGGDLQTIVIPAGELSKNLETYGYIIKKLIYFKANKSTLVVNLGGGVVTDIGGFAASTYMRGIDFINIPTTLLGMIDAAIGGKTGIDFLLNKNYLGTFALPEAIIIDTVFLKTLPTEELKSGGAEMIKIGIIANQTLFQKIEASEPLEQLIKICSETKHAITSHDLYDKGERQLLNFGHTIGHAYESYRLNIEQPIMHGLAIAKGMMAETRIAFFMELINEDEMNIIINHIALHTEQTELSAEDIEAIEPLLLMDKKNEQHKIIFSLPIGIGAGRTKVQVAFADIQKSLFHA